MGDLHLGLGHGEQALEFYQKALEIAEELHRRNPQSADFARDLSVSISVPVSEVAWERAEKRWGFSIKAAASREEVLERNPSSADYAKEIAVVIASLAICTEAWGTGSRPWSSTRRRSTFGKSFTGATRSQPISPATSRSAIADGRSAPRPGARGAGPGVLPEGLEFAEELHRRNPQSADFARDLSVSYERLASIRSSVGKSGEALGFLDKARRLREEVLERNPGSADYAKEIAVVYSQLGDLHLGLGHGGAGPGVLPEGARDREELHRRNPQSADFARDLSGSYEGMAQTARGLVRRQRYGGARAFSLRDEGTWSPSAHRPALDRGLCRDAEPIFRRGWRT